MNYNIHPIFVHFPVALLTVYSLLEIFRLKIIRNRPEWFYIKATILILGIITAFLALQTGDIARNLIKDPVLLSIITKHEFWAKVTFIVYGLAAAAYFVSWVNKFNFQFLKGRIIGSIWKLGTVVASFLMNPAVTVVLAIAGLAALTITGTLGGSIVYHSHLDPISSFIFHLFFK